MWLCVCKYVRVGVAGEATLYSPDVKRERLIALICIEYLRNQRQLVQDPFQQLPGLRFYSGASDAVSAKANARF